MFSANEKYIARIMFKNKVYELDAQAFESLFTLVMQKNNKNFEQVKPYGNIGDWKNDGFDKTAGVYYQVYSPEDISKANTVSNAEDKLTVDFEGLYSHWNSLYPINSFNFVLNDKYKNAPPQLHAALASLENKYPKVKFKLFLAKDLEDVFMSLSDDDMISIVGCIANPADQLDFSALTEVITHLMNMKVDNSLFASLVVPDFNEKLKFNKLSDQAGLQLKTASYQVGGLNKFFRSNSNFTKDQIQQRVVSAYLAASDSIDKSNENYSDLVFYKLIELIYPDGSSSIRNAVLILLAYFFESCDIFERPTKGVKE